jgi:type IV pilus assembly protein PilY1
MPVWSSRNIWASTGSPPAVAFLYANLTATQKAAMDSMNATLVTTGTEVVNYIRGNQAKEESQTGGTLRTRTAPPGWSPILGDIVNSTPTYVGAPNPQLWAKNPGTWTGKSTYQAFATAQASRRPVVWVGGNDGMLHAFDATEGNAASGSEIYAFIPNTAIRNGLVNVADPDYQHRYFVDGDMAIADVYTSGAWRTVLVATMGRGTPGVFALDITNPNAPQFLWERGQSGIPDLGHNIGRPIIAQVADGVWRVLFGNGSASTSGRAKLISIDVMTGSSTSIDTDTSTSNDLGGVVAFDRDLDGLFETAYAGDMQGNMWKFEGLTGSGTATKLFVATVAGDRQPITAAPTVAKDPATGLIWVLFGTGRFLEASDIVDTRLQSWYGVIDTGTLVDRSELRQRTLIRNPTDRHSTNLRTLELATPGDLAGFRGWYMDFITTLLPEPGERMVVPSILVGSSLVGVTRIPTAGDACTPGSSSWFIAINPFTGGRLIGNFWDISKDNLLNHDDDTPEGAIVTGIRKGNSTGGANAPIVIGSLLCTTMDDGSTECIRVSGSSAEARRGSWREITN